MFLEFVVFWIGFSRISEADLFLKNGMFSCPIYPVEIWNLNWVYWNGTLMAL
jgi:hypothetical protein